MQCTYCKPQCKMHCNANHNAYRADTLSFPRCTLHTSMQCTPQCTVCTPQCTLQCHHPFPPFHHVHMRPPTPAPPSPRHPVSSHLLSLVYTARQKVMFANFCADSDLMHNMHCGELKLVKLFMPIIVTTAKYIAIEPWKRDRQC